MVKKITENEIISVDENENKFINLIKKWLKKINWFNFLFIMFFFFLY